MSLIVQKYGGISMGIPERIREVARRVERLIFLFEVLLRLLIPAYRRYVTGTIIFAMILIGSGLSDIINWAVIWSLVIITIGLTLLLRGVTGKK